LLVDVIDEDGMRYAAMGTLGDLNLMQTSLHRRRVSVSSSLDEGNGSNDEIEARPDGCRSRQVSGM
jgi:hypothetical protein